MKIATWNVNSIRSRLEHVTDWLRENPVELLCLQETKVTDDLFPRAELEALGYHCAVSGQKSYNGVALLSQQPLERVDIGFGAILGSETVGDLDAQKRVISTVLNGVRIVNLYVPNGSAIGSEKYDYKLRWLDLLGRYLKTLLETGPEVSVCGDFNIAFEDRDIYKPDGDKAIAKHIMSSPAEREALQTHLFDQGFIDAFRQFTPDKGHYSWWDYRTAAFRGDRGWRIDHHYISPALQAAAIACTIDKTPRGREKPSDHTPVILELDR
ncbi:MAG: exodeoxyribonuclease III [Synechococcales cyanobacterium RM1_1_8]|nr:exodeoxyribonuclease III [Synechococcales cyanobacterium RM1_1_8]